MFNCPFYNCVKEIFSRERQERVSSRSQTHLDGRKQEPNARLPDRRLTHYTTSYICFWKDDSSFPFYPFFNLIGICVCVCVFLYTLQFHVVLNGFKLVSLEGETFMKQWFRVRQGKQRYPLFKNQWAIFTRWDAIFRRKCSKILHKFFNFVKINALIALQYYIFGWL